MAGFVILMLIGLLLAVGLATVGMVRRLRRPPRRTYAWAVSKGLPGDPGELDEALAFEDVDLGERYGVEILRGVRAWEVEGKKKDGVVVVMTPGWGESRVNGLVRLPTVAKWASRVVMWDPPGLGSTPGLCGMGTGRDVEMLRAIVGVGIGQWAVGNGERHQASGTRHQDRGQWAMGDGAERDVPCVVRVVLYGWSMGAGVSIAAAVESENGDGAERGAHYAERVVGVIAESPYREAWTPAFRVMQLAGLPWRLNGPLVFGWMGLRLMGSVRWKGFDRAEVARGVGCKLMVIHGTADEVCPVEDGREIARAVPGERGEMVEVVGGGHNDLWGEEYRGRAGAAVEGFLASIQ